MRDIERELQLRDLLARGQVARGLTLNAVEPPAVQVSLFRLALRPVQPPVCMHSFDAFEQKRLDGSTDRTCHVCGVRVSR